MVLIVAVNLLLLINSSFACMGGSAPAPVSAPAGCPAITLTGATVTYSDSNRIPGSQATHTCTAGYALGGLLTKKTCLLGLSWTTEAITCQKIECSNFGSITNGAINHQNEVGSKTPFGSTATLTCNNGFALTGKANATCGGVAVAGTWTPTSLGTCDAITCQNNLPTPTNGNAPTYPTAGTTAFAATATFSCVKGYAPSHSNGQSCGGTTKTGTWQGTAPTCVAITCPNNLPTPTNGNAPTYPGANPSAFGAKATFTCKAGSLSHSKGQECGGLSQPGTWQGTAPICT